MSEENTQDKTESIVKVLMDYFRDYEMMLTKKLPWPTPEYQLRLLVRVFNAASSEREELREVIESFLRFMPKVLRSPWFVEANGDDVNDGLAICARAELMLCENGGPL